MSTSAYHYVKIKDLERMAELSGFKVVSNGSNWNVGSTNELGLSPADESLPIYTRDVILMRGSAEDLISFIIGWQKSLEYLTFLGAADKKRIERKEQDYKNKKLAEMIKYGKVKNEN